MFNKNYTKWEVLETYAHDSTWYCVQVRMNIKTGLKKFKTTKITSGFTCCRNPITPQMINNKTEI